MLEVSYSENILTFGSPRKMSLQTYAFCERHERSTRETESKALRGVNIAHCPWCEWPSSIFGIFCSKPCIARYSIDFHRMLGLHNPNVDDLLSLLGFFVVSPVYHVIMLSSTECGDYPTPVRTTFHCCLDVLQWVVNTMVQCWILPSALEEYLKYISMDIVVVALLSLSCALKAH